MQDAGVPWPDDESPVDTPYPSAAAALFAEDPPATAGTTPHVTGPLTLEPDGTIAPPPIARVVVGVQSEAGRILANWSVRIANLPAFRAVPDLPLTDLQAGMPDVLAACLRALDSPDPRLDAATLERAQDAAARHGRQRAAAGFPIGALVAELQQLQAEMLAASWRVMDDDESLLPATVREVINRLCHAVAPVMATAAEAWVAAAPPTPTTTHRRSETA